MNPVWQLLIATVRVAYAIVWQLPACRLFGHLVPESDHGLSFCLNGDHGFCPRCGKYLVCDRGKWIPRESWSPR